MVYFSVMNKQVNDKTKIEKATFTVGTGMSKAEIEALADKARKQYHELFVRLAKK